MPRLKDYAIIVQTKTNLDQLSYVQIVNAVPGPLKTAKQFNGGDLERRGLSIHLDDTYLLDQDHIATPVVVDICDSNA